VLAHLSVNAFGESVWSLRLPAALFGIATLWALWRLALELTGPREALLSMALLTFSYPHIWFSQNARGYSALLFWTIASSYYLVRGLRERSGRLWAAYAIAVALGMYTHLTMAFVVAGQFVAYAWETMRRGGARWEDRLAPFFGGFVLSGLLTIVCYALVLPQMPDSAAADLSNVAEWRSLGWLLREFGRGVNAGPLTGLAVLAALLAIGSGCASYLRESPVLPVLFVVPVVSGGAVMIGLGHHLWPRFFLFAAGFAILIAVRGATVVARAAGDWLAWPRERSTALATIGTVVIAAALARSIPYVYRPKQDYEGAKRFVEAARQPQDAVTSAGVAALAFRAYYAPEWFTVSTLAELDAIRAASPRTWLLYTLPIEMENTYPEIYESARRDFRVIRTFDGSLGDGAIYVLRADRPVYANARAGAAAAAEAR
jgi:mannosyltransferase